jgi:hypothetical protein
LSLPHALTKSTIIGDEEGQFGSAFEAAQVIRSRTIPVP